MSKRAKFVYQDEGSIVKVFINNYPAQPIYIGDIVRPVTGTRGKYRWFLNKRDLEGFGTKVEAAEARYQQYCRSK